MAVTTSTMLATFAPGAQARWSVSGYWPMDEGQGQIVHDFSGKGNDGRLGSSRGTDGRDADWVDGVGGVGHALRFDGNDYISILDDASLHPQRLTVEAWARADRSPGRWRYIVSKGGDGCLSASYGLYTSSNGGIAFYVYDGKAWHRSPEGGPALWDGAWHHLAGTYDGATVRIFVDGHQIGDGTPYTGRIWYQHPFAESAIGAYRGSCDLTFVGDIDQVRIWHRAIPVEKLARLTG